MSTKNNSSDVKLLMSLALPVVAENVLQTLLGTVDTYFAGQLGDASIAAIGVTNLIVNVFLAFFTAVSVGSVAVVSRCFGTGDRDKTDSAARQSVLLGLMVGGAVGIVSLLFCRQILGLCGAGSDILDEAILYFLIVAAPSVVLCISMILSGVLRSTKNAKVPMVANVSSNLANIVLNFIFIKTGLGIAGLALATTLSRVLSVVIMLAALKKGGQVDLSGRLKLEKSMFMSVVRIGLPAGIEKLIMRSGQLLYNSVIISLGTAAYVAHNVGGTIDSYTYIPAMGIGVATASLVGISLGENDPDKAKRLAYLAYKITLAVTMTMAAVYFVFASGLTTFFTDTKEVIDITAVVLRVNVLFVPFMSLVQIMTSALQGGGDTKYPMFSTLIGIWGFRVCLGYLLAVVCDLGLLGFWLGCGLDQTVRGLLLWWRFAKGKWKNVKI